jgi:ribosome-binding protein aMBF1 (putative translation factor)
MEKSEKLEKFLGLVSDEQSDLLEKIQWRQANQAWRERSGKIALKILRKLRDNKSKNQFPSSQKELATLLKISPQQVNKIVKGSENLTIETICKIENVLNIHVFEYEMA